jgi:DNA replication protein DnaC
MKEIQAVLSGINTHTLDFKELRKEICEGCEQEITFFEVPLIGGPNKGKLIETKQGCLCEDKRLAIEALEARERAKKQYILDLFEEKSLINNKLKKANLKNYKPTHESQVIALEWAVNYCKTFDPQNSFNALFAGDCGLGKSHLAVGIVKYLILQGYSCIFTSVPKLFTKIKTSWDKDNNHNEQDLLDALEIVDFLVLDDLGAEQASQWQLSKLFEVIDTRQGKPTIYTTNYKREHLAKQVGVRNFDRLFEDTEIIKFDGESFRMREKF